MGRSKEFGRVDARRQESPGRCKGEDGAALVEMAIVGTLLVFLLFGIVIFGYLMSFRQNLTQAAAEGARAGAVAVATPGNTQALADANAAASSAVGAFGQTCGSGGMDCSQILIIQCPQNLAIQCVSVELTYHYSTAPLLPDVPLVSPFLPHDITTKSVAEINR